MMWPPTSPHHHLTVYTGTGFKTQTRALYLQLFDSFRLSGVSFLKYPARVRCTVTSASACCLWSAPVSDSDAFDMLSK